MSLSGRDPSKGDQEGEGATAYLSQRTVRAIADWLAAAGIEAGPVFRRVNVWPAGRKPSRASSEPCWPGSKRLKNASVYLLRGSGCRGRRGAADEPVDRQDDRR